MTLNMTINTAHCTYSSLSSAQHTFHYSAYFQRCVHVCTLKSQTTSYVLTHNLFILLQAMDILSYLQADTALPFNVNIHTPSFTSITMSQVLFCPQSFFKMLQSFSLDLSNNRSFSPHKLSL